ncbi:hypothetical protein B0J11DRAFT_583412 [Dendryphion nanum]|uniref:Luciferase domain-containing protein n=1 Tax=Dendryphion nanum TaxID=256645 RepID=A0A9P9DCZ9_9PLEO|nr:hypothetical protein B0J11DRAFT_583412 [Dendryphion nanum]
MASQYHLQRVADILNAHRAASISTVGLAVLVSLAISDYRLYLSYGPGGLPYNLGGWLVASLFRIITREQLSTRPYDNPGLPLANEPRFLPPAFPPKRTSDRPLLGRHAVPQRQLNQLPDDEIRERLIDGFAQLGKKAEEKGLVEVRQSRYERHHEAMFVSSSRQWNVVAEHTNGEITHVHAGVDGSVHVTLHPADCKAVFEAGWGQRHPLSGVDVLKKVAGFSLPVNYVLLYAPRDQAEVDIVLTMVKASIGYVTGVRDALE